MNRILCLPLIIITMLLAACTPAIPPSSSPPPTETQTIPPAIPVTATATSEPLPAPTETFAPPSPTLNVPTEPSASSGEQQTVLIFLIAVDDNGQSGKLIGCGDSAIPVQVNIPPTQGVLRAALNALLSIKNQFYGESGLYNALYQSSLQADTVAITNGEAVIHLTGTLMLGGECDTPRVEAQLTETALQFSTVTSVSIFINDVPLKEALSLK